MSLHSFINLKLKRFKHTIQYNYFSNLTELPDAIQLLVAEAKQAAVNTYSPYSSFPVGCAIELSNGKIIKSSNQENAAYPSGLCAERVGLFYANSNYPESTVNVMVIYAPKATIEKQPISPCGSCRQVMSEYEQIQQNGIAIYLINGIDEVWQFNSVEDLLPFPFLPDQLK